MMEGDAKKAYCATVRRYHELLPKTYGFAEKGGKFKQSMLSSKPGGDVTAAEDFSEDDEVSSELMS